MALLAHATHDYAKGAWQPFHLQVFTLNSRDEDLQTKHLSCSPLISIMHNNNLLLMSFSQHALVTS